LNSSDAKKVGTAVTKGHNTDREHVGVRRRLDRLEGRGVDLARNSAFLFARQSSHFLWLPNRVQRPHVTAFANHCSGIA
jgi:polysaccharide deacetylase 2 family uncharacterized protein YibQ